ncbi:hypothetical protein ACFX15_045446 [Malus domestica]|nr:uncharacterized protein LOC103443605 isoform X1 [Malus domestica]
MEESRNRSKNGSKGGSDDDDVVDGSKGGSDDDDVGQGELYSPAYSINVRNNKANLDANVGQGELYSPSHAIKVSNNKANQEPSSLLPSSMGLGVAADHIRWNLGAIKDRLLEKVAAAAVPADALDSARHFLESVVKDVTGAAHGITKDALHRVRTHLVDILPSLSPETTNKMVDEAEREVNNIGGGHGREDERKNEEGRQRSRI